jgi:hypothetical protein
MKGQIFFTEKAKSFQHTFKMEIKVCSKKNRNFFINYFKHIHNPVIINLIEKWINEDLALENSQY